jgi:SAM-dependent methyltransferase
MSFFGWRVGRKKAQQKPFDLREPVMTANLSLPIQDTRHYLENSTYQLPKDAEEDTRLNFQHYALTHALGNHYVAPISPPLYTILDVGTGTGIWAREIARLFPAAFVVGIDLAATSFKQPTQENCLLRTGNVLTGLPFPDAFFSFTHQRLLVAGITAQKWPGVIHELVRVTRSGGWIELVEIDNRLQNEGPATAKMLDFMETVGKSMGFDGECIRHLGDLLIQEGLQGVEMQPIPIPVGDWGGRVGHMMKHDWLGAMNALRGRYCSQGKITGAAFDQMLQAMAAEWEVSHPSCTFFAAYGQRG